MRPQLQGFLLVAMPGDYSRQNQQIGDTLAAVVWSWLDLRFHARVDVRVSKINVEIWPQSGPQSDDVKGVAWAGTDLACCREGGQRPRMIAYWAYPP